MSEPQETMDIDDMHDIIQTTYTLQPNNELELYRKWIPRFNAKFEEMRDSLRCSCIKGHDFARWEKECPMCKIEELEAQIQEMQTKANRMVEDSERSLHQQAKRIAELEAEKSEWDRKTREKLAAYAHDAWSGWMKYMFDKSVRNPDGTITIPAWAVERWGRQATTPYSELPEDEKKSDLAEADQMLSIFGGKG